MTKKEDIEAINKAPVFYLATEEGNQPRVRGMLLYKADENEIVFHTAKMRELFSQLMDNNRAELCFNADGVQIRISGKLELVENNALKDEIANHPSRTFLDPWRNAISLDEFHQQFAVFRLTKGKITLWTMERNLDPKIELNF
jgi:uncharacterized pyridoxamine 5'-phosphate oxidase family protein